MMAPYGANEPRMSNNPVSFGAPGLDGDSIILDIASAMAAEGKIRLRRDSGVKLPAGWILNKEGLRREIPMTSTKAACYCRSEGTKVMGSPL